MRRSEVKHYVTFFVAGASIGVIGVMAYLAIFLGFGKNEIKANALPKGVESVRFERTSGVIELVPMDYKSGDPDAITAIISSSKGEWVFHPCPNGFKVAFTPNAGVNELHLVDVDGDSVLDGGLDGNGQKKVILSSSAGFEIDP